MNKQFSKSFLLIVILLFSITYITAQPILTAPGVTPTNYLEVGNDLTVGWELKTYKVGTVWLSPNRKYKLELNTDGYLVITNTITGTILKRWPDPDTFLSIDGNTYKSPMLRHDITPSQGLTDFTKIYVKLYMGPYRSLGYLDEKLGGSVAFKIYYPPVNTSAGIAESTIIPFETGKLSSEWHLPKYMTLTDYGDLVLWELKKIEGSAIPPAYMPDIPQNYVEMWNSNTHENDWYVDNGQGPREMPFDIDGNLVFDMDLSDELETTYFSNYKIKFYKGKTIQKYTTVKFKAKDYIQLEYTNANDLYATEVSGNGAIEYGILEPSSVPFTNKNGGNTTKEVIQQTESQASNAPNNDFAYKIYPNPVTGAFFVELNNKNDHVLSVAIYNSNGQKVINFNDPVEGGFNISSLATGIYMYEISTQLQLIRGKLIKK